MKKKTEAKKPKVRDEAKSELCIATEENIRMRAQLKRCRAKLSATTKLANERLTQATDTASAFRGVYDAIGALAVPDVIGHDAESCWCYKTEDELRTSGHTGECMQMKQAVRAAGAVEGLITPAATPPK